jgi:hypothetical protein
MIIILLEYFFILLKGWLKLFLFFVNKCFLKIIKQLHKILTEKRGGVQGLSLANFKQFEVDPSI